MNQGKRQKEWLIKCIRLAPNTPEQNPLNMFGYKEKKCSLMDNG